MPDISMCKNAECPSREQCYRFMARPDTWQTYNMLFAPPAGADRCEFFAAIEGRSVKTPTR